MFALILGVSVFVYLFFHLSWKRKNLPPGPIPIPFFGNLHSFYFNDMDVQLQKWKKQYGDISTLWFGGQPIITLHDAPTILETFLKDGETYAARPNNMKWDDIIRLGRNGIVGSDGPKWRENRRFALHVFRNFGLGKNLMQERVLEEVTHLITDISSDIKHGSKDISIQNGIDLAVGSIINGITFGYRYGKEKEEEFFKVKKFAQYLISEIANPLFNIMNPDPEYYKKFPICSTYYKKYTGEIQKMKDHFFNLIDKHRKRINFDSNDEPTDFVEAYMRHQYKLKQDGITDNNYDDAQLYATVLDLWIAGQETTSNTLAWLCIYLIQNPKIQQKLHKELEDIIGSDRIITLHDKNNLNYLNAIVAETQRYCNLVPINVPHRTTKATEIRGYKIPANTMITHQISTVLMDERYFPEPEKFMPERFLDKKGKFFQPTELMPFGIGKRACLGEGLARLELYLFTANIFNHFKLDYPSNKTTFGNRLIGATITPVPFLCNVSKRF
uniref:Cytochrome P450 n=1 Tax=Panagrolaimus davidi TaxID=227884 RepID=A0A914QV90_9BILA